MSLVYVDTSVVAGAYFRDEQDHKSLYATVFENPDPVVTSELTRIEFASVVAAAHRHGRIKDPTIFLEQFDSDCDESEDEGQAISLLRFDSDAVVPLARILVLEHRVRTLDAMHVAVALTGATMLAAGEPVEFLTRDERQATAARQRGLVVR